MNMSQVCLFIPKESITSETVYSLLFMSPSSFASSLLLGWSVHLLEVVYVCALEYAK